MIILIFVSWFHCLQHKRKTKQLIDKRIVNTESIESLKKKLYETAWEETETSKTADEAYTTLLQEFIVLYDNYFPKKRLN